MNLMRVTKQFIIVLLTILLVATVYGQSCVNATNNLYINEDTQFCSGTYNLVNGVIINNSNIVLDCNQSTLDGGGFENVGIVISRGENITIQDCILNDWGAGIFASDNMTNLYLLDNTFTENTNHITMTNRKNANPTIYNNLFSSLSGGEGWTRFGDFTTGQFIFTQNEFYSVQPTSNKYVRLYQDNLGVGTTGYVYVYDNYFGSSVDFRLKQYNVTNNIFNFTTTDLGGDPILFHPVNLSFDEYVYDNTFYNSNNLINFGLDDDGFVTFCVNDLGNDYLLGATYNGTDADDGTCPVACVEDWIADLGTCLINDTQLLTYHDDNSCGTTTMLPPQNGTYVACNYCTISYHSEQTACLNETITTYYVNDNFITCCDVTGIPADCDLPSNSTISCSTGDASLITGLVIDTSVEVGRVWVGFAGLIALIGIGGWIMFII